MEAKQNESPYYGAWPGTSHSSRSLAALPSQKRLSTVRCGGASSRTHTQCTLPSPPPPPPPPPSILPPRGRPTTQSPGWRTLGCCTENCSGESAGKMGRGLGGEGVVHTRGCCRAGIRVQGGRKTNAPLPSVPESRARLRMLRLFGLTGSFPVSKLTSSEQINLKVSMST